MEIKVVAKIIEQLETILEVLDDRKFDIPATHIATAIDLLQQGLKENEITSPEPDVK